MKDKQPWQEKIAILMDAVYLLGILAFAGGLLWKPLAELGFAMQVVVPILIALAAVPALFLWRSTGKKSDSGVPEPAKRSVRRVPIATLALVVLDGVLTVFIATSNLPARLEIVVGLQGLVLVVTVGLFWRLRRTNLKQ